MGITHLTPVEALLVALSGLVIVFIMLAVLCVMIPIISKVVAAVSPKKAEPAKPAPAAVPAAPVKAAELSASDGTWCGEIALIGCDEKTAAMVMAIVSHETGIPLNELIFKKIKAL